MNIRITIQGQSVVVGLKPMTEKPTHDLSALVFERDRSGRLFFIGEWYDCTDDMWINNTSNTLGWIESPTITLEE